METATREEHIDTIIHEMKDEEELLQERSTAQRDRTRLETGEKTEGKKEISPTKKQTPLSCQTSLPYTLRATGIHTASVCMTYDRGLSHM